MPLDAESLMKMVESAKAAAAEREADPKWIAARAREEAAKKRDVAEWPYRASGVAAYIKGADLDMLTSGTVQPHPVTKMVRGWVSMYLDPSSRIDRWAPWLWVSGSCGVGKTIAAAEAIARVSPNPESKRSRYVTFRSLMQAHRDARGWNREAIDAARELMDASAQGRLVVLDEVGQELESDKDLARLALHDFVDRRQHSNGITLVLSNLDSKEIRRRFSPGVEWYDSRTESRLRSLLSRGPNGEGLRDVKGPDLRGDPL